MQGRTGSVQAGSPTHFPVPRSVLVHSTMWGKGGPSLHLCGSESEPGFSSCHRLPFCGRGCLPNNPSGFF